MSPAREPIAAVGWCRSGLTRVPIMTQEPSSPTLVIGAGLSGLMAARDLARAGRAVLIVDKGRSVGGRLATRRMADAVLDHGAQFFTVRSDSFRADVDNWLDAGIVEEWCRGFATEDGYPRYRGAGGMNRWAKHIAAELSDLHDEDGHPLVRIETRQRAQAVIDDGESFVVSYDGATREPDHARDVVITSPVPQTLEILASGGISLPEAERGTIQGLRYHAVIGLLATVAPADDDGTGRPSPDFGDAGALQRPDDPTFTFVADNRQKGISPSAAVTFHAAHARSAELWDAPDDEILEALRPDAERLLGSATIQEIQVKKWRYAGPVEPHPDRCVVVRDQPGRLVLAGDAFGGPKVEGAYLSGRAAAAAILA